MFFAICIQINTVPWYLHEIDKLKGKNYAKKIDLICPSNKVFVKYQAQGRV